MKRTILVLGFTLAIAGLLAWSEYSLLHLKAPEPEKAAAHATATTTADAPKPAWNGSLHMTGN